MNISLFDATESCSTMITSPEFLDWSSSGWIFYKNYSCLSQIKSSHETFCLQLRSPEINPVQLFLALFRRRVCIIQSGNLFMSRLLANSSKSRHAHLEDQTFVIGLLGRFTDQAVDGYW